MAALTGVGLSTADFAMTLADLGGTLDWFEELGVASVELSLANFEVIGGTRVYPDRLADLRRLCAGRPFGYTVHGPIKSGFADAAHLDLQRDACLACLEVAAEVGATAQVHHAAILGAGDDLDAPLALERDTLAAIAPRFEAAGVVLAVETLFSREREWTASPVELAAQIAAVGSPAVAATVDFSHVFLNAAARGFDALGELERLAPLTRHLHVHDSFARPRTFTPHSRGETILFGLGDLHLPPGRGALPWERLARLPFAGPTVANLELTRRHRDQVAAAVAWTRAWCAEAARAEAA